MKNMNDDYVMEKEYDFTGGIRSRFYSPKKGSTTIRLDNDVLLYLKKITSLRKVKTLLNSLLREYMQKGIIDRD